MDPDIPEVEGQSKQGLEYLIQDDLALLKDMAWSVLTTRKTTKI